MELNRFLGGFSAGPTRAPNVLTNLEFDRQLSESSSFRLTYIYSRTYNLFVVTSYR